MTVAVLTGSLLIAAAGLPSSWARAETSHRAAADIREEAPLASAKAVKRSAFQAQKVLGNCSAVGCFGDLKALKPNESLELDKVICETSIGTSGVVYFVFAKYPDPGSGPDDTFFFPLAQRSAIEFSNFRFSVFDQDGPFRVPKGKTLRFVVTSSGTPNATCSVFGEKLTEQ